MIDNRRRDSFHLEWRLIYRRLPLRSYLAMLEHLSDLACQLLLAIIQLVLDIGGRRLLIYLICWELQIFILATII